MFAAVLFAYSSFAGSALSLIIGTAISVAIMPALNQQLDVPLVEFCLPKAAD
jgi:hypothetical protein